MLLKSARSTQKHRASVHQNAPRCAHSQRKIVDKNGFFSLVGRHSPVCQS